MITRTVSPKTSAPSSSAGRSSAASTPPRTSASQSQAAAKLPLIILNNTSTQGLAQQAERAFQTGGWTVSRTGNLQNDILSTCAYYDPNTSGAEAAAIALQRQFPAIRRVQPKFTELPAGPLVVVLTSDYSSG